MDLILELGGMKAIMLLKEDVDNRGGPSLGSRQLSEFLDLMATMLANSWLSEQGLRQAA